jgi:hypothetical protein
MAGEIRVKLQPFVMGDVIDRVLFVLPYVPLDRQVVRTIGDSCNDDSVGDGLALQIMGVRWIALGPYNGVVGKTRASIPALPEIGGIRGEGRDSAKR